MLGLDPGGDTDYLGTSEFIIAAIPEHLRNAVDLNPGQIVSLKLTPDVAEQMAYFLDLGILYHTQRK